MNTLEDETLPQHQEGDSLSNSNTALQSFRMIGAKAWGTPEITNDKEGLDFMFTPPPVDYSWWDGITQLFKGITKPFYAKNTSILNNFASEIESIRIFEYNKTANSLPGPNFIGPEIRGRKIDGGSAYVVIYHFKSTQSYFWQPDMIEFHNYKGAMSLAMCLEYMGWKMTLVDHKKELEKEAELLKDCKDCYATVPVPIETYVSDGSDGSDGSNIQSRL